MNFIFLNLLNDDYRVLVLNKRIMLIVNLVVFMYS